MHAGPVTLNWLPSKPDLRVQGDWEGALVRYFATSKDIVRVDLSALPPGRSGAYVLIAVPWAPRGGQPTRLQPELVKLANLTRCDLEDEIARFQTLAEGT